MWRALGIAIQLTRPEIAALVFLAIFVPISWQTHNLELAAEIALPMIPICMCGFVINALHDIEKDRENHPERPLPRRELSSRSAAVIFFVLLSISLLLVKFFADVENAFLYAIGLIVMINYNYVVEYFPKAKNIYVGAATAVPLLLLNSSVVRTVPYSVFVAVFLYSVAMEILSDIKDMAGDGETLAKRIGSSRAGMLSFTLLYLASCSLLIGAASTIERVTAISFFIINSVGLLVWLRTKAPQAAIRISRALPLLGIIFLLGI